MISKGAKEMQRLAQIAEEILNEGNRGPQDYWYKKLFKDQSRRQFIETSREFLTKFDKSKYTFKYDNGDGTSCFSIPEYNGLATIITDEKKYKESYPANKFLHWKQLISTQDIQTLKDFVLNSNDNNDDNNIITIVDKIMLAIHGAFESIDDFEQEFEDFYEPSWGLTRTENGGIELSTHGVSEPGKIRIGQNGILLFDDGQNSNYGEDYDEEGYSLRSWKRLAKLW
jgi:hypothetical protein